jgi:PPK2 family polyphosphate:nucleotide phosphotransferase
MDYRHVFRVTPNTTVKLTDIDPGYRGTHVNEDSAKQELEEHKKTLSRLQAVLYAEKKHAVLIVLQAMDAGGKDGTINHVMSALNPQGATVTSFKHPSEEALAHDFLWRVHPHTPAKGTVAIFNRSHYEDVLVVRVHHLVPRDVWSKRFEAIRDFEKLLRVQNDTQVIKFFLHISREEQLARFKQRLDDPSRNWKITENDYKERDLWDAYLKAFEDVFAETSTHDAPWYIIPANHKWFRNLAVSQIVAATLDDLGMRIPAPTVDLKAIRHEYHRAATRDRQ